MDSKALEAAAYYIALFTVVSVPPGIFLWFLIHPFASFWRRLGAVATYLVVIPVLVSFGAVIYYFRKPLLRIHFEPNVFLSFNCRLFFGVGRLCWHTSHATPDDLHDAGDTGNFEDRAARRNCSQRGYTVMSVTPAIWRSGVCLRR